MVLQSPGSVPCRHGYNPGFDQTDTSMQPQSLQAWQSAERLLNAQQFDQASAAYATLIEDRELAPMAHLRLSLIAGRQARRHARPAVADREFKHLAHRARGHGHGAAGR